MNKETFNIIKKIEEIMGELSASFLLDNGYRRVNGPDIGLDIRAGSAFLDINNRVIVVLGNTKAIEYYGDFLYVEDRYKMKIQTSSDSITVYLGKSPRVEACFNYFENEYMIDLEEEEEAAKNSR